MEQAPELGCERTEPQQCPPEFGAGKEGWQLPVLLKLGLHVEKPGGVLPAIPWWGGQPAAGSRMGYPGSLVASSIQMNSVWPRCVTQFTGG